MTEDLRQFIEGFSPLATMGAHDDPLLSGMGAVVDPWAMSVCTQCGRLHGPVWIEPRGDRAGFRRQQTCTCQPHGTDSEEPWGNLDFHRVIELCHCCAAVVKPSGSRWCVWFCNACRLEVIEANRLVGDYVIPLGRHSIMGCGLHHTGRGLGVREVLQVLRQIQSSEEVFVAHFRSVTEAAATDAKSIPALEFARLGAWRRSPEGRAHCVSELKKIFGFPEGCDEPGYRFKADRRGALPWLFCIVWIAFMLSLVWLILLPPPSPNVVGPIRLVPIDQPLR